MSSFNVGNYNSQISEQYKFLKEMQAKQAAGELEHAAPGMVPDRDTTSQQAMPPFDPSMMGSYMAQFLPNMMQQQSMFPQAMPMMPVMAPMMMPVMGMPFQPQSFGQAPGQYLGQSVQQPFGQSMYLQFALMSMMTMLTSMMEEDFPDFDLPELPELPTLEDEAASGLDTAVEEQTESQKTAYNLLNTLEIDNRGAGILPIGDFDEDGLAFTETHLDELKDALDAGDFLKADLGLALMTRFEEVDGEFLDEYEGLIGQLVEENVLDPRHLFNNVMRDMPAEYKVRITEALGNAGLLDENGETNTSYTGYLLNTLETDDRESVQTLIKDLTFQYYYAVNDWSSDEGQAVQSLLALMDFKFDDSGQVIANDPDNPFELKPYYLG